jgi:UDP-N-acetylglucosamine--N-acetylmuramyl-(pentapeptide) pyrophosphoryl-undecaprenol N-acetylglucosamine transferase
MSAPVVITAGGTGGHVYPALAVARALIEIGVPVVWLGTRRGLESRIVPEAGIPIEWLSVGGLRGKGLLGWLPAPWRVLRAVVQAVGVLRRLRPRLVLGMGGFAAGPGGLAAWLLRRPLVIHEQNAIAGLTNRVLSRLAARVLEGFPHTFPAGRHAVPTGNPVRAEIAALPAPEQRLAARAEGARLRLLVLGGSQGALALNECLPTALAALEAARRPEVWHQAGGGRDGDCREDYAARGVEARVEPFIEDMAAAYAWADLVVCRAGALTIAELTAAGLPSVLVPYPHAVDDHQTANARYLSEAGAALLLAQTELDPTPLSALLGELASDRERLLDMARAARRLARPQATAEVVQQCLQVAEMSS